MLSLHGVTAGYGTTTVLRDVDLRVPDGSVVALIGPNGAGKTTLLRVASGLIRATTGSFEIDGLDVSGAGPSGLVGHGVCHVPEGRGVFRDLTVRENLQLFAAGSRSTEDGIGRAVDAFPRLGERLGQTAGTMSGGEQQMLALARAYVTTPRFVLLDEVSMGLAPNIVDEIFAFLARLSAEGCALLLVEQFVTKALAIADYACLMDRGTVSVHEPQRLADADLAGSYLG